MKKCSRVKNPCKICLESVTDKTGLQCKGACKKWVHFTCLNYTPGKIQDIKAGFIIVTCPCPNCNNEGNTKEILSNPPFTCEKQECPANTTKPKCEDKDCPMNNKTTAAAPIPANQIAETHPTQEPKVEASQGDSTPNIPPCCKPKAPEPSSPCGSGCKISKTGYPPSNQNPQQNPSESNSGPCVASGVQSDKSVSKKNSKTKQKDRKPKSPKNEKRTKTPNDATLPKCCQPSQSRTKTPKDATLPKCCQPSQSRTETPNAATLPKCCQPSQSRTKTPKDATLPKCCQPSQSRTETPNDATLPKCQPSQSRTKTPNDATLPKCCQPSQSRTKTPKDATLPKCCQPSQSEGENSPKGTQSPKSTPSPKSKKSPKRTKSPKSSTKSKKSSDKLPKSLSCSCISVNEVKKPPVKEPGANETNQNNCCKGLCTTEGGAKEANAKKTGVKESGTKESHASLKSGRKRTSHSDSKLSAMNDTDLMCTIAELCSAVGNLSDQLKDLMCKMLKNAEKK